MLLVLALIIIQISRRWKWFILMVFVCESGWKVLSTQVCQEHQNTTNCKHLPHCDSPLVSYFSSQILKTCRWTQGRFQHPCRCEVAVKGAAHRPTACQENLTTNMILVSQILWLLLQVMFYITLTNQRRVINWWKEQKDYSLCFGRVKQQGNYKIIPLYRCPKNTIGRVICSF